jgi:hypothetical protein
MMPEYCHESALRHHSLQDGPETRPVLRNLQAIELTIANVHGYFKAETHFSSFWFGPHVDSP